MTKGTSSHPEVFIALAQAYESGNRIVTERVESILTPNAAPLPEQLQLALDGMGDSPIAEPELFAALQSPEIDAFISAVSERVNLDAFDAMTVSIFVGKVRIQILSDMDKDGVFKTTPALEAMRLPKLADIRRLTAIAKNGEMDAETFEKENLAVVGLEKVKLSVWEKDLVKSITGLYAQVTADALIGKATDRTPFSRYLKNI